MQVRFLNRALVRRFLTIVCALAWCSQVVALSNESYLISSQGSGRATGYDDANKIITLDGLTHVAWLDSEATGFAVKIRTLDQTTNSWSDTYKIGDAKDNHGGPAITIDSQGYLHAVYYPHNGAMRYRKSVNPNDASAWEPEIQFGQGLTYPTLLVGPDDTLYMTARQQSSGMLGQTSLFKKTPGGNWSSAIALIQAPETNYVQLAKSLAWGPNHQTLHLAGPMYGDFAGESQWAYKMVYMKSEDFGQNWTTYDGTPVTLPALESTMDTIYAVDPSLHAAYESVSSLTGGQLAVDSNNIPHVLYNELSSGGTLPHQAWLATPDGQGGWGKTLINDKISVLPEGWGLLTGGITIDSNNHIGLLFTMVDDVNGDTDFGGNSNDVIWAESTDGGQTYISQIISEINPNLPSWLPNLERPTGFNEVDNPSVAFTYGERGANNNVILQNDVVFWMSEPRTGILGDINQDGELTGDGTGDPSVDDLSAFIKGWNWKDPIGTSSFKERYEHGDLNYDRVTDLKDAVLLGTYYQGNGMSPAALKRFAVPEPGSLTMIVFLLVTFFLVRRKY